MTATVVRSRKDCEELTACETLESVHHTLVSAKDESAPVGLKEVLDAIRAEFDDISGAVGVTDEVRLNSKVLIAISWVRPQDINDELLFRSRHLVNYLQRSLNLVDLVKAEQGTSDTAMQTDNPIVDDGGQGQPIEQVVDLVEDRVDVGGLLTQTAAALLGETKCVVDPLVLVVATKHMNLVWELDFECHQETDSLKGVCATINVITQEEVVVTLDIAIVIRDAPQVEESHQILVLAMDIAEYFNRGVDSQHHGLLLKHAHTLIGQGKDMLPSESKVTISIVLGRPLSRSEKMRQEQIVQRILRLRLAGLLSALLPFLE